MTTNANMTITFERGHSSDRASRLGFKPDLHRAIVTTVAQSASGKPYNKIVWVGESKSLKDVKAALKLNGFIN
jgi:hypothetical protein